MSTMPLSEFLRLTTKEQESVQPKPCPTDLSSRTNDDFVELVWENGQIMMQGQSSRITRSPPTCSLPSRMLRVSDAAGGSGRIGKFSGVESTLKDVSPIDPSGNLDLSQNNDMVPWLNYSVDDSLPHAYCSELLPDISCVTANGMLAPNSSGDKANSNSDSGRNPLKVSSSKARLSCSWSSQQGQTSYPSLDSGVSDIVSNNTSNHPDATFGNSVHGRVNVNDSTSVKLDGKNIALPSNNSYSLNFSHFSRPATLPPCPMVQLGQQVSKEPKESFCAERTKSLCQEPAMKNEKPLIQANTANSTKGVPAEDKTVEPIAACSSAGSPNSADMISCEQNNNLKRKINDIEEPECHSDDIETEFAGVRKAHPVCGGRGSKRSRAAQVHNLSERRRRDRINEKMRALQELIPNCNKVDKASMLDEAIEYLKSLQLQVQIMSMGAGLCTPTMMFPSRIQHLHPAHVPYFSPMGVGMGMGFGMGMLDMNGGSPGCPVFPTSALQGANFPSSARWPTNYLRTPGSSLPVYGPPSPGLYNSVPGTPLVPLTGQPHLTSAVGLSALRISNQNEVPSASPTLNPEDAEKDKNSGFMQNAEASSSISHGCNQLQGTAELLNQSSTVEENDRTTEVQDTAALTTTAATDITKEAGCN